MITYNDFSYRFQIGGLRNRLILIFCSLFRKSFSGVSHETEFSPEFVQKFKLLLKKK